MAIQVRLDNAVNGSRTVANAKAWRVDDHGHLHLSGEPAGNGAAVDVATFRANAWTYVQVVDDDG